MQVTNGLIFVENDSGLILVLAILKNLAPFTLFHSSNILIIEKGNEPFFIEETSLKLFIPNFHIYIQKNVS